MKVLKTNKNNGASNQVKVCPRCGEKRTPFEAMRDGDLGKGIVILESYVSTFFHRYRCYNATCLTCGTEWESDPF